MPTNTIIFDFNGVIIDDEPIHCELFQKVLLEEDIHLTEKDYWETYLGFDDHDLICEVYKRDNIHLSKKKLNELTNKKNNLYLPTIEKKLKFFDGALEFIQAIKNDYHLAIVSGALRNEIDFVLEKGGINNLFSLIISADDVKHGKPHPEGYMLALAKLKEKFPDVQPKSCLVIEDSFSGIEAALKANLNVLALTHTYPKEKLTEANHIFESFGEISSFLLQHHTSE